MLTIAIIEDSNEDYLLLKEYLGKYFAETNISFEIDYYSDPEEFLLEDINQYDLCYLDVEMPKIDGISLAKEMRKREYNQSIVFVTNIYSLAASGYEVDALDYILKPIKYPSLSLKMDRIVRLVRKKKGSKIALSFKGEMFVINQKDIIYLEVNGHNVSIHTCKDTLTFRSKLSDMEKKLDSSSFAKCNNCYLVNLAYVSKIVGHEVLLTNGVSLQISFPRKKRFIEELNTYILGGKS